MDSVFKDLDEICNLFAYISSDSKILFIRRLCLLCSSYHSIAYSARVDVNRKVRSLCRNILAFDKDITN